MKNRDLILIPLFAFMTWLALTLAPAHAADSSACYSISNADARSYCIARARHDRSACYTIQKADLRAQCQAEVQ